LRNHCPGLTLLAWSNSIGDTISNVAIARRGCPRMAISACIAGPMFSWWRNLSIDNSRPDLLVGIGVPFTLVVWREGALPVGAALFVINAARR